VILKNTNLRVSAGRRQRHENTEICVTRKACELAKTRKVGEPTKTRKPVWRLKNAEIPNSRNPMTCSKTSGTRPELRTSGSPDICKDGEDQRPMQNRILEQMSSAWRRTSGPTRRVKNDDSDADKAWIWKGSKPRAEGLKLSLRGSVENQAQNRHEDTAEAAVGRIRVNGLRPVRTYG
jgi:hypothetical protein